MSEELNQNLSSNSEEETPVVEETTQEEAPVVEKTETEELLEGLEKQFSSIDDLPLDVKQEEEEGSEEEKEEEPEKKEEAEETSEAVDEYDPDELYNSTKSSSSEVETLKASLAEVQAQLAQLREAPKGTGEETKKPLEILPLVSEEDFELAMQSPEAFNRLLNRTMYTAYEMANRQSGMVAAQVVSNVVTTQKTIDSFLASNPDLKPHEKLMSLVWRDVAASKPQASLPELLIAAGEETRRVLKLKGVKTGKLKSPDNKKTARPAFARPSGGGARGTGQPKVGGTRGWDW